MSIRNRELSQFGSFIYIDDATKTVGIATTATPYVGIGTTNATHKLTVVGDTNISGDANVTGVVSATSFYLNGNSLVDAALQTWDTSGFDIYRLTGNVGIGTSVFSSKFTVSGDTSVTGVVTASRFISTVTTGTAPFTVSSQTLVTNLNADYLRGKTPPTDDLVGTTDTQTLTNKTLILPTFGSTGVAFSGSTSGLTTVRASATASGIVDIPSVTGIQTFVVTNAVGVVTSGMIADLSIVNADVASGAAIDYSKLNLSNSITNSDIASGAAIAISKLASSTISGISLGNNLNNLTAGSFINYSSGSTYNGSSAITVSVAATTTNTANTVVARNASGDFSAGTITCADVNATFNLQGNTLIVTRVSAGSTVGTAGSVLASTGTGIQWVSQAFNPTTGIVSATQINDAGGNVRALTNNIKSTSYVLAIGDVGELINISTGGVTVPQNIFSAGDNVTIYNNSASSQTITQGSGVTLRLAGTTATGNRTLELRGLAAVLCVASNEFVISGAGLA